MAPERERGAALLTVLLIVAVISVVAATALERLRLATRLSGNTASIDQSRSYAMAAEALTMTRIDRLLGQQSTVVTLAGGWSGKPYELTVPGGVVTATITDGDNCFNLNGLVGKQADGSYAARPEAVRQFARLMRLVGINDQAGRGIAAAAADWIDSDNDPQPGGAEDSYYSAGDKGYRTAGTLTADASELRAVAGVTPQIYAKLQRWICALPQAEPAKMNVNTLMPEDAPLFAMLLPDTLDAGRAQALLLERPPQGFTSTVEFWKLPARNGITADQAATEQTAVTSRWFKLKIRVELGDTELNETALIDATQPPARLASRSWGDPI